MKKSNAKVSATAAVVPFNTVSTVMVSRSPELIAAEINYLKDQTTRMAIYNAIEIGRRLVEAKAAVPHGEWGKWLETSVDYSQSTANNFMKIYEEYGPIQLSLLSGESNSQALGNINYTQAIALMGIPREEREEFVQTHNVDKMSSRQLQKAIKERDNALKQAEEATQQLEDARKAAEVNAGEVEKLLTELKQVEADRDLSRQEIGLLTEQLACVPPTPDNQAEIEELQKSLQSKGSELEESLTRIAALEIQLQEKPEPKVIEVIPEDIQKELDGLRAELKQVEADRDQSRQEIDSLTKQLASVPPTPDNQAEIEELQKSLQSKEGELEDSLTRIAVLEKQLQEKPEPKVVEVIPEDIQKELDDLRADLKKSQQSTSVTKYSLSFETLVQSFKTLLTSLEDIQNNDPASFDKHKKATLRLIEKMRNQLNSNSK